MIATTHSAIAGAFGRWLACAESHLFDAIYPLLKAKRNLHAAQAWDQRSDAELLSARADLLALRHTFPAAEGVLLAAAQKITRGLIYDEREAHYSIRENGALLEESHAASKRVVVLIEEQLSPRESETEMEQR